MVTVLSLKISELPNTIQLGRIVLRALPIFKMALSGLGFLILGIFKDNGIEGIILFLFAVILNGLGEGRKSTNITIAEFVVTLGYAISLLSILYFFSEYRDTYLPYFFNPVVLFGMWVIFSVCVFLKEGQDKRNADSSC